MEKVVITQICAEGGKLTAYLHDPDTQYLHRGRRPAILVIPGGGYEKIVDREGDGVAFEFFSAGFNAFILEYLIVDKGLLFEKLLEQKNLWPG